MKYKNIFISALLATFGTSAAPLTVENLTNSADLVCGMRDTLDLKVPFDNHLSTEPLNGVNRGVVHAAKDAVAKREQVLNESLNDCRTDLVSQYNSNPKLYGND
jgi:hypothetical protein